MQPPSSNTSFIACRLAFIWLAALFVVAAFSANSVLASGFPPVANDDNMVAVRGGTTTVLSDGSRSILDNDFDSENDRLTIFLSRNVRRGTLTIFSDGTFSYTHNGSGRNSDQFRYFLFDGTRFSGEARVRIEVVDAEPIPPQIVGQDSVSVNEDRTLNIDIESLEVIDPDNEFPDDFNLEVRDGENYDRNNLSITPTQNFNGQLNVPVRVFDGSDFSNLFSLVVDVRPRNDDPFVVGTPPNQEAIESVPMNVAFAEFFDDVDVNDTLEYSTRGLPSSGSLGMNRETGVLSGVPVLADVRDDFYDVAIIATDAAGGSAETSFQLTILRSDRADLSVSANVSVNPITVGEAAQWNIAIENLGPADLEEGELVAQWSTSGPALSLTPPNGCTISANDSPNPSIRCSLNGLAANAGITMVVDGEQNDDGDNSLLAVVIADDPITGNNSSLVGTQVVAEFSEGPTQILGLSGSGVAAADLDGDGLEDLVVTSNETTVFFNSGNRTVTTPGTSLGLESGGVAVVVLDWNGDAALDIAVAGTAELPARLYINSGAGLFSESIDLVYNGAGSILALTSADFNQDGFDDLVLTGTGGSQLLQSSGQADFSLQALPAAAGIDVSVADLNGDGSADILIVESENRNIVLLRNSGDGSSFSAESLQRGSAAGVTGTDLNGDGAVDLLLAIDGSDLSIPESLILYQQSDGSFPDGETIGASPLSKMLAGDVDGDAVADIVAVNAAGVHQLYRANPDGTFALGSEQIVSGGMRSGILVDFNNDESLDLIMAGPSADVVEIYANNGIGKLGLGDRAAPVIQLNGEARVTLVAGSTYADPGATATDDIDGDLTESVLVSGSFNAGVVGTYTLNYSVADKAGNQAAVSRTIVVEVNEGQGGGGGGSMSMLFVCLQLLLLFAAYRCLLQSRPIN